MNLERFYYKLPLILIICSFGTYISINLGLRVEHLVIYPFISIYLLISILKQRSIIKNQFMIFSVWFLASCFMIIRTIMGDTSGIKITRIIAELENFIQPLLIMSFFMFITIKFKKEQAKDRLIKVSKLLIIMLLLNTIWSLMNIFIDFSFINIYFWGGVESVSSRAMTNGRYSGIFNQPMEAGIAYSIGIFAWLYLNENEKMTKFKNIFILFMMIVGGLLTVSKVFLFGGVPLFSIGVLLNKKVWKLLLPFLVFGGMLGYGVYSLLSNTWIGFSYLFRFFGSSENIITLLTAGRFGEQSQQAMLFEKVWKENALFGSGFGLNDVYDSGFFHFFANGGIVGLIFYILILSVFVILTIEVMIRYKNQSETKFFIGLSVLILGVSFGAPVLTLNRVSLILWVFIGLLNQYFYFSNCQENNVKSVGEKFEVKPKNKKDRKYKIAW